MLSASLSTIQPIIIAETRGGPERHRAMREIYQEADRKWMAHIRE